MNKICIVCKIEKPIQQFSKYILKGKVYHFNQCRKCKNLLQRQRMAVNRNNTTSPVLKYMNKYYKGVAQTPKNIENVSKFLKADKHFSETDRYYNTVEKNGGLA